MERAWLPGVRSAKLNLRESAVQAMAAGQHWVTLPHGRSTTLVTLPAVLRITRSRCNGKPPDGGESPSTDTTWRPSGEPTASIKICCGFDAGAAPTVPAISAQAAQMACGSIFFVVR